MTHDWADYLPPEQRRRRELQRRRQRWLTALRQRRVVIGVCIAAYLIWCLALLAFGMLFASILSVLPLLCLPCLAYLAWWLVWKEFNN
jgi:hypothetical protein